MNLQANMLSQFFYPYKYVELLDCLLDLDSIYRLVRQASLLLLHCAWHDTSRNFYILFQPKLEALGVKPHNSNTFDPIMQ